ncbi:MAG: hypothetical protein J07HQX50_01549 [Haloquadratum sp. J07HQX50]|nr:MAG: hypothetical protein J07HQX50_01549 [Haloquadratum sp. J07HQX50]
MPSGQLLTVQRLTSLFPQSERVALGAFATEYERLVEQDRSSAVDFCLSGDVAFRFEPSGSAS